MGQSRKTELLALQENNQRYPYLTPSLFSTVIDMLERHQLIIINPTEKGCLVSVLSVFLWCASLKHFPDASDARAALPRNPKKETQPCHRKIIIIKILIVIIFLILCLVQYSIKKTEEPPSYKRMKLLIVFIHF